MKEKIALVSILTNSILAGGKIGVGFLSGSIAILAEGLHSFMDIFSSAVGYVGIRISKRPEDKKRPYGYYKFEVLSGVVITLILLITGLGIIWEAYKSFLNPEEVNFGLLAFGVMIFSAIVNEIMARLKIHFGKKEDSIALLSDGIHSRVDVFASLAVFVGLFLTKYWVSIDSLLALFIGLYIIKESFSLGKEAIDSLLDVSAGDEFEKEIKKIVDLQKIELSSLKTQKKGSIITAELEIKLPKDLSLEEATKISDGLRKDLMNNMETLKYVSIEIASHETKTGFYRPPFGRGFGWQRKGRFVDELEGAEGKGPGGICACLQCDYEASHKPGKACSILKCPNCNVSLVRR